MLEDYKATRGHPPDSIFIDYAGIMAPTGSYRKEERWGQLDGIFLDLKQLARDEKARVITALQMNRESVKSEKPGLEHISLSDLPAQHCDAVYHIRQKDNEAEQTVLDLLTLKQRYGSKRALELWANWPCTFIGEIPENVRLQMENGELEEEKE